jgi:hypothetical protein
MRGVLMAGAIVAGAMSVSAPPAQAVGCLSGAVLGGVAGHVAGHHGVIGAVAGCAIGHHAAVMQKQRDAEARDAAEREQTNRLNDQALQAARAPTGMPVGGPPPAMIAPASTGGKPPPLP